MNKQLLEQFKRGEVILYTPTFEDFIKLMQWCAKEGINWSDGDAVLCNANITFKENNYKSKGIIKDCDGISYISGTFPKQAITLTTKDLEPDKPTFTKSNLKIGMVVEIKNSTKYLVYKGDFYPKLDDSSRYIAIKAWNDNLENSNDMDIIKVYKANNLIEVLNGNYDSLELIWERDAEVDWSKVAVDTKILVIGSEKEWRKRHFAKYANGQVYAWGNGMTSFSANNKITMWYKAKLYKEGE